MARNRDELARFVQQLIDEKVKEKRGELEEQNDVHEAMVGFDLSTFKIISEARTEADDTVIKWEAVDYITTEFTVDEPHRIKRTGTLILNKDGTNELSSWWFGYILCNCASVWNVIRHLYFSAKKSKRHDDLTSMIGCMIDEME